MKRPGPLRPISDRRLRETNLYRFRSRRFLLAHPYCQIWLAEHDVAEGMAIRLGGVLRLAGAWVSVPRATEIHHRNKRRGANLLDERHWLAVSAAAHDEIENHKAWARTRGYLLNFS